jgi:uncharacterized protein (TIGR00255 family)
MIKSMTGYGKAEAMLETGKVTVEVRSLNGKTADISIKTQMLPKDKEMAVRQKIASELTRGNIDFFVTYEPNTADGAKKINADLAVEYYQQISALGSRIGTEDLVSKNPNDLLAMILRMPEVMMSRNRTSSLTKTGLSWRHASTRHLQVSMHSEHTKARFFTKMSQIM